MEAKDMSWVVYYNKQAGHYFFDEATMKFWGSKIESVLYKNGTFITSEDNYDRSKRVYTVRYYNPKTAGIETVGEFGAFSTKQEAKDFALKYKRQTTKNSESN